MDQENNERNKEKYEVNIMSHYIIDYLRINVTCIYIII